LRLRPKPSTVNSREYLCDTAGPVNTAADAPMDRQAISAGLEASRRQLHGLLTGADAAALRRYSDGTRWTNEQLLFHMVFGYLVVRVLLPLVRVVSRLPAPVGREWAALLNSARRPFHVINYWGSVAAARVFNHVRMGRLADRTIAALQWHLEREPEASLRRGMPFPTSWDPYFTPYMTLAEVYRYPTQHFEHHRRQLSLPAARPGERAEGDEPQDERLRSCRGGPA
jgi:hypothetical protein